MILQWNADHIFDQDPSALQEDFPGGSVVNVGDAVNVSSISGLEISSGEGHGNPLQYS